MHKYRHQIFWILLALAVLIGIGINAFKPAQKPSATPPPTQNQPTETQTRTPAIFYPITNYNDRILYRFFGKYVNVFDKVPYCGATFTGFHTGDDLEATSAEQSTPVPVYAISDAAVKSVGHVAGYGGILVLSVTISNQNYTIYYGHIDLSSTTVKAGDSVKAGTLLAYLGQGCSTETDGERKHLHFAIHKGATVDVRGYVSSESELTNWIYPKDFLAGLSAASK